MENTILAILGDTPNVENFARHIVALLCLVLSVVILLRYGHRSHIKEELAAQKSSTVSSSSPDTNGSVTESHNTITIPPPLLKQGYLTMAVISDTHGFQNGLSVPMADILVHCGDFTADNNPRASEKEFDQWLGQQPHKLKLVVRGNHDSRKYKFRSASVLYAVNPKVVVICGVRFFLLPWTRRSKATSLSLGSGDVLVSHCPPYGCLDTSCNGMSIGDKGARKLIDQWHKPPVVWLCGHVHEERGSEKMGRRGSRRRSSRETSLPLPFSVVERIEWWMAEEDAANEENFNAQDAAAAENDSTYPSLSDLGFDIDKESLENTETCEDDLERSDDGFICEAATGDFTRVFNASNANDGPAVSLEPTRIPLLIRLKFRG